MSERRPRVAVVVATHRRPDVLALALRSLVDQSFTDWTALVVGDACEDDTASVVTSFADPRLTYVDLAVPIGEQSGPNNVGIARTTAPLVAFLNHDDLWFPDHLAVAVDTLDARRADLVFSPNITVHPAVGGELPWVTVDSLSAAGRYDAAQVDRSTPASSWVATRELLDRVGGWPAAQECVVEPSQELLLRAHRRGARLWSTGVATVITLASGTRVNSYGTVSDEHRWFADRLRDPGFRALLLACEAEPAGDDRRRDRWSAWCWRRAARIGIAARRIQFRRRGLRAGDRLRELRRTRGLDAALPGVGTTAAEIRRAEVRRSCAVAPDTVVMFDDAGDGHRCTASGWSRPEPWGVWSVGGSAELAFGLAPGGYRIELDLHAHVDPDHPMQRVTVTTVGQASGHVLGPTPTTITVEVVATSAPVSITLSLPDAFAPSTDDRRVLGVGLRSAVVRRRDVTTGTVVT